ncbi:hypothetical protein Lal_00020046 [Lupinus albus]|nr:hypothetical protein Lal_00020046 [Lupinus albus]
MRLSKKMMIVALHCIQTRPSDRPSMKEVLEMLDGDEDLPMPSKPYLYPHMQSEDVRKHISSSLSSDITGTTCTLLSHTPFGVEEKQM